VLEVDEIADALERIHGIGRAPQLNDQYRGRTLSFGDWPSDMESSSDERRDGPEPELSAGSDLGDDTQHSNTDTSPLQGEQVEAETAVVDAATASRRSLDEVVNPIAAADSD